MGEPPRSSLGKPVRRELKTSILHREDKRTAGNGRRAHPSMVIAPRGSRQRVAANGEKQPFKGVLRRVNSSHPHADPRDWPYLS